MSHHDHCHGGPGGPGYSPYGQQYSQGPPPQVYQGPPAVVQEHHHHEQPHHEEHHHHHGIMHKITHPF
ncbi:hypothetical protein OESDEN_17990, partial [Oesophagostomum dentatum]